MLILQRQPGESFWIGKDIQIVILGHFNGVTRIGIKAPPEIKIVRDEINDKEMDHKYV
jgi:carbon storage regulator